MNATMIQDKIILNTIMKISKIFMAIKLKIIKDKIYNIKIMNATKVKEKKDYYKKETNLKI
jgi:hypothetical protein